jgi:2-methylisocitrate lyase-like PEP mutase family enzyme
MSRQREKGCAFRALHERNSAFIIPNPWDVGTAREMQDSGTFGFVKEGVGSREISAMFAP